MTKAEVSVSSLSCTKQTKYNSNTHMVTLIVLRFYRTDTYCRLMPCFPQVSSLVFTTSVQYTQKLLKRESTEFFKRGSFRVYQLWAAARPVHFPGVPAVSSCSAYAVRTVTHVEVVFMSALWQLLSTNFLSFSRIFFLSFYKWIVLVSPPPQLGSLLMLVCQSPMVFLTCIYLSQIRGSWAIFGDKNSLISLLICKTSNSCKLQETDFLSEQRTIVLNVFRLCSFTNIL